MATPTTFPWQHPGQPTAELLAALQLGREAISRLLTSDGNWYWWAAIIALSPLLLCLSLLTGAMLLVWLIWTNRKLATWINLQQAALHPIERAVAAGGPLDTDTLHLPSDRYEQLKWSMAAYAQTLPALIRLYDGLGGKGSSLNHPPRPATADVSMGSNLRVGWYLIRPLIDFISYHQATYAHNQRMLDLLDANAPQGRFFRAITEDELWRNRNHAYQYLV